MSGRWLLALPLGRAGYAVEIALEQGNARAEPLAVGGELAHLGGEPFGLGWARWNLGRRLGRLAGIGEGKAQAFIAGVRLTDECNGGERHGRRAAPTEHPPNRTRCA